MTPPAPGTLRAIFGLPPEQAIAYLQRKGYAITWNWHDVQAAAHARAFTVAKMTSLDLLRDVRNGLSDNLSEGKTVSDFVKDMQPTLETKGWWGKQEVTHDNGVTETVRLGTPRRLKTIYQTNAQSAFMGGRTAAMREAIATHPYWMYIAVLDASTRPSHATMHGKVYRADDPIWEYITPPNDFNCRCRIVALTEAEVKARGLVVESSEGKLDTMLVEMGIDKRTGEVRQAEVTVVHTTDRWGKAIDFHPAAGFNSSPVASHVIDDLLLRKAQRTLGDAAGLREVQQVLLSPARQAGWRAFVDGTLAAPIPQQQTMAFGVLRPQDMAYLQQQGAQMQSGVVFMEDALLMGTRAPGANTLSAVEWHALPQQFAAPEQVLWDQQHRTLLYVFSAMGNADTKIAVRLTQTGFTGAPVNAVARVMASDIAQGIASGMYRPI